jgi:outer membrane protein assembly factor BamB
MARRRLRTSLLLLMLVFPAVCFAADAPELAYRVPTGGRIRGTPTVGPDGSIYLLSEDRHFYCLKPGGEIAFRVPLRARVADVLAAGPDGTAYVGLDRGTLMAVNATGRIRWRLELDSSVVGSLAVSRTGVLYAAVESGSLYAVAHTGKLRWRLRVPGGATSGVAADGAGRVYVGTGEHSLVAMSSWGDELWAVDVGADVGAMAVGADGTLYAGVGSSGLLACSTNGRVKWQVQTAGDIHSIAVDAEGRLVCGTGDGRVLAYAPDGSLLWGTVFVEGSVSAPAVDAEGRVHLTTRRGSYYVLNADGSLATAHYAQKRLSAPTIAQDGTVLIGSSDWNMYAFRGAPPSPGPWPQFHGGSAHAGRPDRIVRKREAGYEALADFQILRAQAEVADRDMKHHVLNEVERRIDAGTGVPGAEYILVILERLAAEGVLTRSRLRGRKVNDYPDIRARAILLMGILGNLETRDQLLHLLRYEYDSTARLSLVRALGMLGSDFDGEVTRALAGTILRGEPTAADRLLIHEILATFESIYRYHGSVTDESVIHALLEVFKGSYPTETRQNASVLLREFRKAL